MENQYHFNLIKEAIHYLSANYQQQPDLEEVASHVHLSKYHFQRLFQSWAGVTPKQFLQHITTEQAKQRLLEGQSTLATAYEVGLSGNGRLHDLFIKIEGCTPGEFQQRGKDLSINYAVIPTPFGDALIAETTRGICLLMFLEENEDPLDTARSHFPYAQWEQGLAKYGQMVARYFEHWEVPQQPIVLDLKGTPFQLNVWKALLSIPSSQFLAYQDISNMINKPKAVRAVGTAIGKNPIAYLIPCHRVIRQTGHMGGYRWGIDRKMAINGYESVILNQVRDHVV